MGGPRARRGRVTAGCACMVFAVAAAAWTAPARDHVSVGVSRALQQSGFLRYLTPIIAARAGLAVDWQPAGDEEVIRLARGCGVDAILVDSPDEEDRLMREGIGGMKFRVMRAETGGQGQFSIIVLNPGACHAIRFDPALRLLRWLTSSEGQKAIAAFAPRGVPLYRPNAGSETCTSCESRQ